MWPNFRDLLVVDDDCVVRKHLAKLLEPAGFRVRQAANGIEALHVVREECPFLMISDWLMSPMNGLELCRVLRDEKLPHYVYVVLLTAKSQTDDVITGLNSGADDFLTKPVRKGELMARLQAGLRILELEHRLSELAGRDPLTGVLNRRTFYEVLEREWSRADRYGHPLSCAMIDIDFFKKINDTYGHMVGDHVLTYLAQSLEGLSRRPDYICRWGGEEFCALLPETDEDGASVWAECCRTAIAAATVNGDDYNVTMTASFGVAQRQSWMEGPKQLIGHADQALYAAKRAGRHCVVSFETMNEQESVLAGQLS
jgi:two-component system chemotaxis response regulator CheY